jgi:preprotein translocase subunit SecF
MKFKNRLLVVAIMLAILAGMAYSAITEHTVTRVDAKGGWTISAHTADASGGEVIKATSGSGQYHYLTYLIVGCDANITVDIGSAGTTDVTTKILTIPFNTNSGPYVFDWRESPVQLVTNTTITIDGSGGGDVFIYAEGFTDTAN